MPTFIAYDGLVALDIAWCGLSVEGRGGEWGVHAGRRGMQSPIVVMAPQAYEGT